MTWTSSVPEAAPQGVRAEAEDSSSIRVAWSPPPVDLQNGHITHYKLYYVEATHSDKQAVELMLKTPLPGGVTEFVLEELKKWTQYRIWLLAGTIVGEGPASEPITVRTQEDGTYSLSPPPRPSPFISSSSVVCKKYYITCSTRS